MPIGATRRLIAVFPLASLPVRSDVLVIPTGANHFLQRQERMEQLCRLHWKPSPPR